MGTVPYFPTLTCCSPTTEFWFANYVMIEWYGAAADGVTDDTNAFLRALATGRPIAFEGGKTYALMNITIDSGSLCPGIFSLGSQAHLVPPANRTASDVFFIIRKPSDFVVENIFFDMPVAADAVTPPQFNRALWFAPTGNTGTNYRVSNCKFSGGGTSMTGVGYIIRNSRFENNYITATYGDGMSFNCCINVEIVDNIIEYSGIATGASAPAGAIRTGTNTQRDTTYNLTIARNIISYCCIAAQQSAIDCFSGAARNIRITDNICSYNGAGIELKTMIWTPPETPPYINSDVYEHNVVANNTIRLYSDRSTSGITCFHADPGAAKGKAENVKIVGNMISSTQAVTPGLYNHVAITVLGHDNVMIDSNYILNAEKGIVIGGTGPVGDTADHIVVSNNDIDVTGIAVQHGGGTLNNVCIRNNPLLRVGASATAAAVEIAAAGSDFEISGNRIESLAGRALELRAITNSRVTDNTLIGATFAVIMQGTAVSGIKVRDNDIFATVGPALTLSTGTGIEVQGNNVDVPIGSQTWSGAATVLAANNLRGMSAADPDPSAGGSLGDIFLDQTAATDGWRCTTAGAAGVAAYTVR